MKVETNIYTRTHGKSPRGRGLWFFSMGRGGSWTETHYSGSYTEAKQKAVREARSLGADLVVVQP